MSLSVSSMPPKDCGWFGEKCFLDNFKFPILWSTGDKKTQVPVTIYPTQVPTYQGEKVNYDDPNSAPGRFEDPKGVYDPYSEENQAKAEAMTPKYQGEKVNYDDPNSAPGRFEDPKGVYDPYSEENQAKAEAMTPKYPFNDEGIIPTETEKDCGWFGEKCLELPKFPKIEFSDLGNIPLYIGGGIMAYFLLKSFGKTIIKGKLGV